MAGAPAVRRPGGACKPMKWKSTVALLAAVIVAGVVAYVFSKAPTSDDLAQQHGRLLPGMRAEDVAVMEISSGGVTVVCRRSPADAGKWTIDGPLLIRADRWSVEGILDRFETADKVGRPLRPDGAIGLPDYGLDQPIRSVMFRAAPPSERQWSVLVGSDSGVGDLVFVAPEDKSVIHTVRKSVLGGLDVGVNGLRSKKLSEPLRSADLTGVEIEALPWGSHDGFQLSCGKAGGAWELRRPLRDPADPAAVGLLIQRLNDYTLAADDFVPGAPAKAGEYGLERPDLTLALEFGDDRRLFVFSARPEGDGEVFHAMSKAEGAIVRVNKRLFESLRQPADNLRDRSLVRFHKDSVRQITVTRGHVALLLEQAEGEWRIAGDLPAAADGPAVEALLSGLEQAEIREFLGESSEEPAPHGLAEGERWDVALRDADGKTLARVQVGAEDEQGKFLYARRADYPALLSVPVERYVQDLKRGRLAFLDREILDESEGRAVRVALQHSGEKFLCERTDEDAEWRLVKPVQGRVDQFALTNLIEAVSHLSAEGFAAESADDPGPFGLDDPRIVAEVTWLEEKDEEDPEAPRNRRARRLLVGHAATDGPEGFYARLGGDQRVLIIAEADVGSLRINPASKAVCEAQGIESIEFRWDGESRTFLYEPERRTWRAAVGEVAPAGVPAKVQAAALLLASFEAASVASYVEQEPALYGFDRSELTIVLKDSVTAGKTVELGKEAPGGGRYVKGPATSFVHVAHRADAEALLAVVRGLRPDAPPAEE